MAFPVPGCSCLLPQSFSSEPSGQSSVPSQSFSAGRQMVDSLAHIWWESLHTSASQLSSSELSSQSLSPSHTQALLIQRATDGRQRLLLFIFKRLKGAIHSHFCLVANQLTLARPCAKAPELTLWITNTVWTTRCTANGAKLLPAATVSSS